MRMSPEERIRRSWQRLAVVWALYYFAAFTLGQIPQFVQRTIWMGAALVGVATVPVLWRHISKTLFLICAMTIFTGGERAKAGSGLQPIKLHPAKIIFLLLFCLSDNRI